MTWNAHGAAKHNPFSAGQRTPYKLSLGVKYTSCHFTIVKVRFLWSLYVWFICRGKSKLNHREVCRPRETGRLITSAFYGCVPLRWSGSGTVIQEHRPWCITGTDESVTRVESSVPSMYHIPSDLGSLILFQNVPKENTICIIDKWAQNRINSFKFFFSVL